MGSEMCIRDRVPTLVGTFSCLLCVATIQFFSGFEQWIQFVVGTAVFVSSFLVGTLISELRINFGILTFLQKHIPGTDVLLGFLPTSIRRESN